MAANKMTRHIYDRDNGNGVAIFTGLPAPPTRDVRCQEMSMTMCCTKNLVIPDVHSVTKKFTFLFLR